MYVFNTVYHMKETGWTHEGWEDVGELHYKYKAEKNL